MTSIKSHLTPKFYLKGFLADKIAPDQEPYLFVYRKGMPYKTDGERKGKNPFKSGLDNIGFVRNFYAYLKEDGDKDVDTFEKKLSNEIEIPGNPVLDKLRSVKLIKNQTIKISDYISQDERERFASYVSAMCARVSRYRRQHDEIVECMTESYKQKGMSYSYFSAGLSSEKKEKLDKILSSIYPEFDQLDTKDHLALGLPAEYLDDFKKTNLKNNSFPVGIFRAVGVLTPRILKMKWQIRITEPHFKLFTGDDPVYWTKLDREDSVMLFPISSNALFVASNDRRFKESIFTEKNHKYLTGFRELLARKSNELYFSREASWLVDFLNNKRIIV